MTPQQMAADGLAEIKKAILLYLAQHPDGAPHAQIVSDLGLESAYEGGNKNYLSWSVIGLLMEEGKVRYDGQGRSKRYFRL